MIEIEGITGVDDTESPVPTYLQSENGNVGGEVSDLTGNSNGTLASVFLRSADSYNYTFSLDEYIPGMDNHARWELSVDNPAEPAKAVLSFIDRTGNDTTITIQYDGIGTSVSEWTGQLVSLAGFSPNPAQEQAVVRYSLATAGHIRMALYNQLGEEVRVFVDEIQQPGEKTLNIRTTNFPTGMYLCRLTSGNTTVSGRLIIVH